MEGGQEKEVGAGCRGHRRALSSEFRKAGRCHHGNCRAGTSLKKKKDKFDDFICYLYTLHQGGSGGLEVLEEAREAGMVDPTERMWINLQGWW